MILEWMQSFVNTINDYLYSYILTFLLIGSSLFFSIITNFVQFDFKNIFYSFQENNTDPKHVTKISPFEAFSVSAASRIGTGNIAGIALAIMVGGPGTIFWMWVTALLGGAISFAENTLAQVYKVKDTSQSGDGHHHFLGGPSYYILQGLNSPFLSKLFGIILIFVFGFSFNAVQANTISQVFYNTFDLSPLISAVIIASLSGFIIFKGINKIAKISSKIVPIMSLLYLILCFCVIALNIGRLTDVLNLILSNAFGLKEFGLGTLTATIITGVKRGLFSNEAGMGSAPNAAASAHTSHPAKQGFIQAFGVFLDTIVICSATGFLILFSGIDFTSADISGITLTQQALYSNFGEFGSIFLTICIFLLAFSSILGNYFYVQSSFSFLSKSILQLNILKISIIISIFLGSISSFEFVWNMADLLMGIMTVINLYAVFKLRHILTETLLDYRAQKSQKIDPVFKKENIINIDNVECW
ncbi:MAG: alanine/glycine:cation symporter family protein [Brevinemataceae bacterium]